MVWSLPTSATSPLPHSPTRCILGLPFSKYSRNLSNHWFLLLRQQVCHLVSSHSAFQDTQFCEACFHLPHPHPAPTRCCPTSCQGPSHGEATAPEGGRLPGHAILPGAGSLGASGFLASRHRLVLCGPASSRLDSPQPWEKGRVLFLPWLLPLPQSTGAQLPRGNSCRPRPMELSSYPSHRWPHLDPLLCFPLPAARPSSCGSFLPPGTTALPSWVSKP